MAVLIGSSEHTRFSYVEYQFLMICLAVLMVLSLLAVELALTRFQVLPLLFPGMFSVRERRFFCFNFDISDGKIGKRIRAEAKMLIRMTVCLVLSYLWQHCVLQTSQHVGTDFPREECAQEHDCFASELDFVVFFNRQYTSINCKGSKEDFTNRVVISCIQFVAPEASKWLMHVAIAHSVTQLNFKAFELLVWIAGNSPRIRFAIRMMIFMTFITFLVLFFAGALAEFVSSWLSFVMSLSIPVFLYTVAKSGHAVESLWKMEAQKVQLSIEQNFNAVFADIEAEAAAASDQVRGHQETSTWLSLTKTTKALQQALKTRIMPGLKPSKPSPVSEEQHAYTPVAANESQPLDRQTSQDGAKAQDGGAAEQKDATP